QFGRRRHSPRAPQGGGTWLQAALSRCEAALSALLTVDAHGYYPPFLFHRRRRAWRSLGVGPTNRAPEHRCLRRREIRTDALSFFRRTCTLEIRARGGLLSTGRPRRRLGGRNRSGRRVFRQ